jgi:OFA family oxalate/formate antiporter-like MFS transporter
MQAVLGLVMAWSVFRDPLIEGFGWTISEVTLAFTINYLAFGFAAFFGGLWLTKVSPRTVAITAAGLYGLGVGLASLANGQLWLLYLSFGLLSGVGRGIGYIVPVAVLVKWFPDRRGLVTGLAAAGFAAGGVIGGPLAAYLITTTGVLPTFAFLGIASATILGSAALFMQLPPEQFRPPGWQAPAPTAGADLVREYTLQEALCTPQWYGLWALIFFSGSVGLALTSQVAPMAQEITGIDALAAGGLVGMITLGNLAGRFGWAWLSDAVGRRGVYVAIFLLEAAAFALMPLTNNVAVFGTFAFVVVFGFGGGLGTMPALVADYFGSRNVGAIFGLILTASGFGSVLGPLLLAYTRELTGGYTPALVMLAGIALSGATIPLLLHPPRQAELTQQNNGS